MNERLQQLAEQSGISYLSNVHPSMVEKFAELIVRECSTLAYDSPNGILDHFGLEVEE